MNCLNVVFVDLSVRTQIYMDLGVLQCSFAADSKCFVSVASLASRSRPARVPFASLLRPSSVRGRMWVYCSVNARDWKCGFGILLVVTVLMRVWEWSSGVQNIVKTSVFLQVLYFLVR